MYSMPTPLVLASRSPRRRAILTQLGIAFEPLAVDVDELTEGDPEQVARENARRKARAAAALAGSGRPVLGVDTDVFLDGHIFGKPRDFEEARRFLTTLSGRRHDVWSAIALIEAGGEQVAAARTSVRFRDLDRRLLDWYLASGEWCDRAGGYAIQGRGAALVAAIEGDYWNVVGLPVALLLELKPDLIVRNESFDA
jgi:septum formation protein